MKAYSGGWL